MLPGGVFNTSYDLDMPIVRTKTQWLLLMIFLAFVLTIPQYAPQYWLSWLIRLSIAIIVMLGLHVLTGLCGQLSVGQAAIMGVGAYTAAILTTRLGWSPWLCLPMSALSAGLVGIIFGLPSCRIRGFYLAMSTLAAQFLIVWAMMKFSGLTGGPIGLYVGQLKLGPIDFGSPHNYYYVAIIALLLCTLAAKNIQRTNLGRKFVAIRDNELAAQVSGINLFRHKLLAFFIACLFAGVAGWLWVYAEGRVNPEQFRLTDSIWYLGMMIVGGLGSTTGVFFGAIFFRLLEAMVDQIAPVLARAAPSLAIEIHASLSGVLFGVIVLIFLIREPSGLYHRWEKFKASYRIRPYSSEVGG